MIISTGGTRLDYGCNETDDKAVFFRECICYDNGEDIAFEESLVTDEEEEESDKTGKKG